MKIGLGTAQFGSDYGISNRAGAPSDLEVSGILDAARRMGIDLLDTAPDYGNAEDRIGETPADDFLIVTKTRLGQRPLASLASSLQRLGRARIYGCLIHHAADLAGPDAAVIVEELVSARSQGLVKKIGVSVYNEKEIADVLKVLTPDIIQLPANIFDQRLVLSGRMRDLHRRGIEIHARSVFLQGLLLMSPQRLPAALSFAEAPLRKFDDACIEASCTRLEASIAYAASIPEFDRVLVGVASQGQLKEVVAALDRNVRFDFSTQMVADERILDPATWSC